MANPEHVDRLLQGVEAWNQWREENPKIKPDFNGASFEGAYLNGANLVNAYLINASFEGAYLNGARLNDADFNHANLNRASLNRANLCHASLYCASLNRANLINARLEGAFLEGANLYNANLYNACLNHANLHGAGLRGANLNDANLHGANLINANLKAVQALGAGFQTATLTGACIEDWHINSRTNLQNVVAEYIFTNSGYKFEPEKYQFTERRPHDPSKTFAPGEFAALVQKSLETVDLIFVDGINWKAFFLSFQQLQEKHRADELGIQAIEKKPDGAFVIRLEVAPNADKAAIEQDSESFYNAQLKALEAQYQEMLRLQGDNLEDARRTIENERQEKATLMAIVTTMANNQSPRNDFRGARFGGGVAIDGGTQTGGTLNDFSDDQGGGT